jgi:hypothetical protein
MGNQLVNEGGISVLPGGGLLQNIGTDESSSSVTIQNPNITLASLPSTINANNLAPYIDDIDPGGGALSWEEGSFQVTYIFNYYPSTLGGLVHQNWINPDGSDFDPPGFIDYGNGEVLVKNGANILDLNQVLMLMLGYSYTVPVLVLQPDYPDFTIDPDTGYYEVTFIPPIAGNQPIVIGGLLVQPQLQFFLSRGLPLQHPLFPWMVCTRIDDVRGLGPRGKIPTPFIANQNTNRFNYPQYMAWYEKYKVTASFSQPKYNILPDSAIDNGNEFQGGLGSVPGRYIFRDQQPSTNFITLDQGSMVFAEGPYGPTYPNNAGGFSSAFLGAKAFTSPGYAQIEAYQNIVLNWTRVPEEYVCDVNGNLPRFDAALGCCNLNTFMNYPPGTLLFEPYHVERYRAPMNWSDGNARFWLDIKMIINYFNPPASAVAKVSLDTPFAAAGTLYPRTVFGHQTAPSAPNQYYEIVGAPGGPADGLQRYRNFDFNSLFYPLSSYEINPDNG